MSLTETLSPNTIHTFQDLEKKLEGKLLYDEATRLLYATDASAYREIPLAVAFPKHKKDLITLVQYANAHKVPLIMRTAGTSLAGQVVGRGIIADVSVHMNQIGELNVQEQWIWVQPGVVLDELNLHLKKHGLLFGPETSTSNRCMIGGMLGNNSCGSHSLIYGSTRDHTLEVESILADGTETTFRKLNKTEYTEKLKSPGLLGDIYRKTHEILGNKTNREIIAENSPKPSIHRRNTGYALDLLALDYQADNFPEEINMCTLLAGSEGTLAISTAIKLHLEKLPPPFTGVVAVHFANREEAFQANIEALKFAPVAIEMIDNFILEATKNNLELSRNRQFIQGDPAAILVMEFFAENEESFMLTAQNLITALKSKNMGYHYPIITGSEISKIWTLRKAGLGVLSNIAGDRRSTTVIEDTAVDPADLPAYMADANDILMKYGIHCVYYAHIGSGELHLRPMLDLRDAADFEIFKKVAHDFAVLVKKYRGSLSGEHGDGRLRGEFVKMMVGPEVYAMFQQIKQAWDPQNILNPGKIVEAPPMTQNTRHFPGQEVKHFSTILDFSETGGILKAAEKCTGSGDCRKSELMGGTMCPSYMATHSEKHVTRARANILREYLTNSTKPNPFAQKEIYEVMDLCLSCKACKSECPSSVDVAKLKAEFLQQYYSQNGVPLRAYLFGYIHIFNSIGSVFPWLNNAVMKSTLMRKTVLSWFGISRKRIVPMLSKHTMKQLIKKHKQNIPNPRRKVYLFADEFINFNESEIGLKALLLLEKLGYQVEVPKHKPSGRALISKGLLKKARGYADDNIELLRNQISEETPLIGIEPSAILTFRDEYPVLVSEKWKADARKIAQNTFLIEEFLMQEMKARHIQKSSFTKDAKSITFHGHCHQKSLAGTQSTKFVLSFPENYTVDELKTGCCGMAGSFGYETEHYDVSVKVAELVLYPSVRKLGADKTMCANGTSCRHQIMDGTGVHAQHPVEILYDALVK